MKAYSITIDETTATTFLQRVAHWQPVAGLDNVVARLAEYCTTWHQAPPPSAEELEQALAQQEAQGLLTGGPQFPGLRECRFTLYPYGRAAAEMHTISIVELGERVVLPKKEQPETTTCPSCEGSGLWSQHSTTPCSTCNGEKQVPIVLLKRAEKLADECLVQNPQCWKKQRQWAREQATAQALSELIDDAGETDEEELDEQIAEGLHEWINESYDNRH